MTDKPYIPVEDIMARSVYMVDGLATVREAISKLVEHGVSSLVVTRRDAHDEYGMVHVADIARKVIAENLSPDRVQVYEIMSKPVLTVPAEMSIKYAIRHLVEFKRSRAAVIDHQRELVGIVTLRDMVLRFEQTDL
ncbi:MAG: CBS domain-containing protein [Rhodospirillales bacterium]|nr:CBS domain-containing protein [Rhodospirillales bacterium]